ncbi:MAG: PilN domain-containing protein [Bacteroidota bacterium]
MKKKDFIGLALDKNKIYTAHLTRAKGRLELVDVETMELPEIVESQARPRLSDFQPREAKSPGDDDVLFGLDDDTGDFESIDLDEFTGSETEEDDETRVGEGSEEQSNEQVLSNFFTNFGKRSLQLGVNIAHGKTIFQPLEAVDLKKMKKKEQKEYVAQLLSPMYDQEVTEDQYAWEVDEQGDGWLISYDNDHSFLSLIDLADITYDGSVSIREMMSDEIIWTGMVRSHYELSDDQITGLVSIGERSSRLIFMKGDRLFHVLPVINEGSKSRNVLQTLFSKLLFEIDKGTLPALDQMIVMQSTKPGTEVIEFFRDQFIDVDVDMFRPDPHKLTVPEELKNNPEALRPYITAIGAAQAASGFDTNKWPDLSLLPEYIRERQRYLKLEWHGAVLLVMIALAPLVINMWYQNLTSERDQLAQDIQTLDTRIVQTRPVAQEVEQMLEEQAVVREVNDRIVTLSRNNLLWSETLGQINNGIAQIPNTWLTSLRVAGDELQIEGYTLYRNRIPLAARVFNDARINSVNEGMMREADVLEFSLRVHNFKDEEERFSPEIPEPDEDVIREVEVPQIAQ